MRFSNLLLPIPLLLNFYAIHEINNWHYEINDKTLTFYNKHIKTFQVQTT